jgi:molybdopterin molybdotransferase
MRPFTHTIAVDEARAIIAATVQPIERTVPVPLSAAAGRVLAEDVVAAADVPPFPRASMDGYALRAADTTGASRTSPRTLRWSGQLFTGEVGRAVVDSGRCIEIATGAPIPEGADAVIMVEETLKIDETVQVFAEVRPRQNIGRQGADIERGQTVLRRGDHLNPSRVGALAALGASTVVVYDAPRVAILSTGNEIVEPGQPLEPAQIYDINRFTLAAVVCDNGGVAVPRRIARDTIADLGRAIAEAEGDDLILFSGGSSVGERDLMMEAVRTRGDVKFHGLAVKPGKPTAFGLLGHTPFFGLPGYPTSCLSNAYILVAPALRALARLPPRLSRTRRLPLGRRIVSTAGRHQFYSVRLEGDCVMPAFKNSGDITSLSQADGYIEIPSDIDTIEEGTPVDVTLFS